MPLSVWNAIDSAVSVVPDIIIGSVLAQDVRCRAVVFVNVVEPKRARSIHGHPQHVCGCESRLHPAVCQSGLYRTTSTVGTTTCDILCPRICDLAGVLEASG